MLTKFLLSLYEDMPGDAVNYLKVKVEKLQLERLQSENADLKSKVCTSYYYWLF